MGRTVAHSVWVHYVYIPLLSSTSEHALYMTIKIVEPVHAPKRRHHPLIKLLDKGNLLMICLLVGLE
jgi:hypothetical protein